MFTGIVEEIGTIEAVRKQAQGASFRIKAKKVLEDVHQGDSINTNGVCLTVTNFTTHWFEVDAVLETLQLTNLKTLAAGSEVNLERALKVGDRLGGHMVSGHIDGTGVIHTIRKEGNASRITIQTSADICKYIVRKGSVALDGISLTVAEVQHNTFTVAIIPHTGSETTLLKKNTGDPINIENDISAKYIEKFMALNRNSSKQTIDYNYLNTYGFID